MAIARTARQLDRIDTMAAEAVKILGIDAVLDPGPGSDGIFDQFADCERLAEKETQEQSDGAFISTALPIASALIHYATTLRRLDQGKAWVAEHWNRGPSGADPASVLALLTLIYVVNEGAQHARKPQDKALWKKMQQRVAKLKDDRRRAAA